MMQPLSFNPTAYPTTVSPSSILSFLTVIITTISVLFNLISGASFLDPYCTPFIYYLLIYIYNSLVWKEEMRLTNSIMGSSLNGTGRASDANYNTVVPSTPPSSATSSVSSSSSSSSSLTTVPLNALEGDSAVRVRSEMALEIDTDSDIESCLVICKPGLSSFLSPDSYLCRTFTKYTPSHPSLLLIAVMGPLITVYHLASIATLVKIESTPEYFHVTPLWFFVRVTVLPNDLDEFYTSGNVSFFVIIMIMFLTNFVLFLYMSIQSFVGYKLRNTSFDDMHNVVISVNGRLRRTSSFGFGEGKRGGKYFDRNELIGMMGVLNSIAPSVEGEDKVELNENGIIESYLKHLKSKLSLITSSHQCQDCTQTPRTLFTQSSISECTICFEPLDPAELASTTCSCRKSPIVHTDCILKWKTMQIRSNVRKNVIMLTVNKCPFCREEIWEEGEIRDEVDRVERRISGRSSTVTSAASVGGSRSSKVFVEIRDSPLALTVAGAGESVESIV